MNDKFGICRVRENFRLLASLKTRMNLNLTKEFKTILLIDEWGKKSS